MGSATFQAFPDSASAGTGGIRPPYRFIEEFRVLTDGAAEARPRLPEPWPIWASAFPRTALPIEWAVQLYGARVRVAEQRESRPGYLASVREFRWGGKARADRTGEGGAGGPARRIHEFTAGFFSGSGTGCAWMAGTVYFPGRTALAPAPASPSDAGAGARGGNDAGRGSRSGRSPCIPARAGTNAASSRTRPVRSTPATFPEHRSSRASCCSKP